MSNDVVTINLKQNPEKSTRLTNLNKLKYAMVVTIEDIIIIKTNPIKGCERNPQIEKKVPNEDTKSQKRAIPVERITKP